MLDTESNLLKSFLLKKVSLPHRRLEQQTTFTQPIKIAHDSTSNCNYKNVAAYYPKYSNNLLHILFSAILRIEFDQGLFALLMAQAHRTAFLQVTNEILFLPDNLYYESILHLKNGHPLLGAQQCTTTFLWPAFWPQPGEDQATKGQSAFRILSTNKYMHIMNGNYQSHICPRCQYHLGRWFYHNFPKKFRSQPVQRNNGMMVHHIKGCKTRTSVCFFRRGQRQYHSFTGHGRILLHEQLKLAGAARGLPGDHGPPKSSFFPTSTIYHHTAKRVVTNAAVRRGTALINV